MKTFKLITALFIFYSLSMQATKAQVMHTITSGMGNGQDAQIWWTTTCPWSATQNFGGSPSMAAMAWTWNSLGCGYGEIVSYLQFDMSSIPSNHAFENATLRLFYPPGHVNQQSGQNDLFIQRVTSPWQEAVITWNAGVPTHTVAGQVPVPAATNPLQNYNINVTNIVNDWLCGGFANHGFRIALQNYAAYRSAVFATKEHGTPGLHPQLVLQLANVTAAATNTNICAGASTQLSATVNGANPYTFNWTSSPAGFTSSLQNPTVSPTQTTTYIVTATGPNGCAMTSSVTVVVNQPSHTVAASATPSPVCIGNPVQLSAFVSGGTPPFTYSWTSVPAGFTSSLQNPSDNPVQNMQYLVMATDANGCSASGNVNVDAIHCCYASGQPYTKFHASFVDNFHMHPLMEIEEADMKDNGNVLVYATIEQPAGVQIDGFLGEVDPNNNYLWSRIDGRSSSNEHALCVKEISTGEYIVSGITTALGGSHAYLQKTDATGNIIWTQVYDQSTHFFHHTNVTELNTGDFAIVGTILDNATSLNQLAVIHTDPNGNLLSYSEYSIANRNIGVVRDVTPTSDDGFVLAGELSHDIATSDYIAALLMKFDPSASLQWWNDYRITTSSGTYDLGSSNPADRSTAVAQGVMEDVNNNKYVAVGYANDYGFAGSGTYWKGFIFEVDPSTGALLNQRLEGTTTNDVISYRNISMNAAREYLVCGYKKDPSAGLEESLYTRYDNSLNIVNPIVGYANNPAANIYNRANSIFEVQGSSDIMMFGYDMHYNGRFNPYVMRFDQAGNGNCPNNQYQPVDQHPNIDMPFHSLAMANTGTSVGVAFISTDYCAPYLDQCTPQLKQANTDVHEIQDKLKAVNIYPNPARNEVTVSIADSKDNHPATLTLTDYTGRVVKTQPQLIPGTNTTISISELPAGVYMAIIQQNGIVLAKEKLVVIH